MLALICGLNNSFLLMAHQAAMPQMALQSVDWSYVAPVLANHLVSLFLSGVPV